MALIPLRAQVRERHKAVVGWLLHKALLLVPRSPTPRTNCSSRPPMAPEGLGAAARSPTVLLYAAKKAERTSCSRVSRSLRAASLWRGKNERVIVGAGSNIFLMLQCLSCFTSARPTSVLWSHYPYGSGLKYLTLFPS